MLINKHLYGTSCLQMVLQSFFISLMCQVSLGSKCYLSTSPGLYPSWSQACGVKCCKGSSFWKSCTPKLLKKLKCDG